MAVFKCKMCEANLEVSGNTTVVKCEYCGTAQTVPWAEGGASGNAAAGSSGKLENLLKRGNLSLEDGKWDDADKYFDRVLDINVEEPRAYIGKLLAENHVRTLEELWESKSWNSVKAMDNYKKAYRFAGDEMKKLLDEYYTKWAYREACAKAGSQYTPDIQEAIKLFTSIIYYEDSEERIARCRRKIYDHAARLMELARSENDFLKAKAEFDSISDYQDANLKSEECAVKAREAAEEEKRRAEEEKRQAELRRQEMMEQRRQEAIQEESRQRLIKFVIGAAVIAGVLIYIILNIFNTPKNKNTPAASETESVTSSAENISGSDENISDKMDEKIAYYAAIRESLPKNTISAGIYDTAAIRSDGTVFAKGDGVDARNDMLNWTDITAVSSGNGCIAGLKSDGTVVVDITNDYFSYDLSDWSDIVEISAGSIYVSGLKSDGTVIRSGAYRDVKDWTDIVAIAEGSFDTVGLKSDGTVVTTGDNLNRVYNVSDWTDIVAIASNDHTVGLKSDGTVVATGDDIYYGKCDVSDWTDIVAVSVSDFTTVGLKSDGTVVAVGRNYEGQCDVSDWTDIIAVAAGSYHTIGLKSDGTLVAAGSNNCGQSDISDWTNIKTTNEPPSKTSNSEDITDESADEKIAYYASIRESLPKDTIAAGYITTAALQLNDLVKYTQKNLYWTHITAIANGGNFVAGLKSDGTVVFDAFSDDIRYEGVSDWSDIVSISAGLCNIIGIKSDGTVVVVGDNEFGQCNVSDWTDIVTASVGDLHIVGIKSDGTVVAEGWDGFDQCKVSDWNDIVAVSAGFEHTIGLKSDGTVRAAGDNRSGQCNVSDWTDIVAVSAGEYHTIGLKSDGTVIAVGDNEYGQCDVSDWTDIVAISAGGMHTIGLKSDCTMVAVGDNEYGQCDVSDWTYIRPIP